MQAVSINYLRAAAGVTVMDSLRNERFCEHFGMAEKAADVKCRVVEWIKKKWFSKER